LGAALGLFSVPGWTNSKFDRQPDRAAEVQKYDTTLHDIDWDARMQHRCRRAAP
jgi:hypothetical protein